MDGFGTNRNDVVRRLDHRVSVLEEIAVIGTAKAHIRGDDDIEGWEVTFVETAIVRHRLFVVRKKHRHEVLVFFDVEVALLEGILETFGFDRGDEFHRLSGLLRPLDG